MPAEPSNVSGHRRARSRSRSPWANPNPTSTHGSTTRNRLNLHVPSDTERSGLDGNLEPISVATSVHGQRIDNNNSNSNILSGMVNVINNNPNVNLQADSGAFVNYAPVISLNTHAPIPNEIQATIAAALKERHVPNAAYDAQLGKGCMDGTRVQILRDIENWILNPKAQQIFWITGMAGTGKSAIAWTVCSRVRAHNSIVFGGSFFCSRSTGSVAQRDVRCVIPTLVQLLARQSPQFSDALVAELARDPDILHKQVATQVKQLLYTPLLALKDSAVPVLFVIDALDECGGLPSANETSNDAESHRIVSEMLEALVDFSCSAVKLLVKFLVTSRPETHIRDTPVSDDTFSTVLCLHTVNKEQVASDIRLYISARLSSSPKLRSRFTDNDADMLARLCDGLFIVATTALQYILGMGIDGAASRFKTLLNSARDGLSSGASAPLDRMYSLILIDAAGVDQTQADELQAMQQLLASLFSSLMALSVAAVADLLNMDKDDVRARLSRLHAVVHVPDDDADPSLRTLHASFGDYLFSRAPSHIRISKLAGNDVLARGCLRVMANRLHFNVSQSRSSHEPNPPTKPDTITLSLEYACLQWIYHRAELLEVPALDEDVQDIFCTRFLFWLEVMSVLGKVQQAVVMLVLASKMVRLDSLACFLRDCHSFVASSREAIEESAPHIYLSALPFAAKYSLVYQRFYLPCSGLISVETFDIDQHGERLVMTLTGHERNVGSVAYSPDGLLIGSGSDDGTVRIWDTRTGEETTLPLHEGDDKVDCVAFAPDGKSLAASIGTGVVCIWSLLASQANPKQLCGHSDPVWSVAFSPDSTRLASGSQDKTVRLWQAETGHQIAVMNGHSRVVNAVTFSPDGATLASCSGDGTIKLWHAATGELETLEPLQGPGSAISSICFSPDSTKLVSGDGDGNIQFWNLRTRMSGLTLRGHSDWIRCIRFSPDGQSLVSCADHSVHLWAVPWSDTPSIVLNGHTAPVTSVSFSPDGLYITSASQDYTIRIWDVRSRTEQAFQPLQGHKSKVSSVAVSPDGRFIVSALQDGSIRVWDGQTGELWLTTLVGHTSPVYSVAISSNGHLIASASEDTVQLWDLRTGETVGDLLTGHMGEIHVVAFSPDTRRIASGSNDCTVRIWDVATSRSCNLDSLCCAGGVVNVTFSSDSRFLAVGDRSGYIYLWHADTSQLICGPLQANNKTIFSIAFSPDGTRIVTGSGEPIARIWEVITGQQLLVLEGHDDWVISVAFSPVGQFICSATWDGIIRLWSASTGAPIVTLQGYGLAVRYVVFTPDGRSIVSYSHDSTIRVWDVEAARSMPSRCDSNPVLSLTSATLTHRGWLVGPSGELLVWVPSEYRRYLQVPPCTMLIGPHRVKVTTGAGGWHHGESWTFCWRKDMLNSVSPIM